MRHGIGRTLRVGRCHPPSDDGIVFSGWALRLTRAVVCGCAHSGRVGYASTPDGRATVWDLAPDHVRDEACALAGRNLTQEEWHRYLAWAGPRRKSCPQFPPG